MCGDPAQMKITSSAARSKNMFMMAYEIGWMSGTRAGSITLKLGDESGCLHLNHSTIQQFLKQPTHIGLAWPHVDVDGMRFDAYNLALNSSIAQSAERRTVNP